MLMGTKIAVQRSAANRWRRGKLSRVALMIAMTMVGSAFAQDPAQRQVGFKPPVLAFTYDMERAKTSTNGCACFWLDGVGVDVGLPFYKGLGLALSAGGGHATNIQPGVSLAKIDFLAGPRYTLDPTHLHAMDTSKSHIQLFGETLFGIAYAFDGTFPAAGGTQSTAKSFAMQLGGGIDVTPSGNLGLRVIEVDYVRTDLPNNGSNSQNDVRLAFGLSYHFAPH